MSYQNPAFMVAHPASEIAVAEVNPINAAAISNDDRRAFIDGRQGEFGTFTPNALNGAIQFDFGSAVAYNRCVIPKNHIGIAGESVSMTRSASATHSPMTIEGFPASVVAGEVVDFAVDDTTTDRYWAFQVNDAISVDISLGEIWFGDRIELTAGDGRVDSGFDRSYEHDVAEESFGGRTASLELSPARRKFSLRVRDLDPTGTDFATLEEVIRDGRTNPFWYWTPDDTDTGPYLVKLTRSATRKQSSKVPLTYSRYEVGLEMLEQVT